MADGIVAPQGAEQAIRRIRAGSRVWLGSVATPLVLLQALEAHGPPDIEYLSYLPSGIGDEPGRYSHRSLFVTAELARLDGTDRLEYVPMALADAPALLASRRLVIDAALLQVTPPDASGFVSLGVSVDLAQAVLATGCLAIGQVNRNLPRTHGDTFVPASRFAALVEGDAPVQEYVHPPTGDVAGRIARYIAAIIEDGSTLQVGTGRWPAEAIRHLTDRRDLGIHSDVLTDGVVELAASGALTGARKSRDPYRMVASTVFGSRMLYDFLHDNPGVALRPIEQVADPLVIAAQHRMVSITQAFAIDLAGQACIDQVGARLYGGVSTQPAFIRGAARSTGGKAILCLASTDEAGRSRIRLRLDADEAVGIPRADVHYVVTEWGVAYLFGRSIRERALALIEIAHPDHRDELLREAVAMGWLRHGQKLASQQAYPVDEERSLTLKGGIAVRIRPARAGDAPALQGLFHRMSEQDRYTRFFRRMKSLSRAEAETLCNVNHETEVAFLAVSGEREAETVLGSACYFLDPASNMAEIAFMVAPEAQGIGLGRALQDVLAGYARRRGVRGFVYEILPGNHAMRKLAMAAPGTVSVESDPDSVHVTALLD